MPAANSTKIFIAILVIIAAALGYNYFEQPFAKQEPAKPELAPLDQSKLTPQLTDEEILLESLAPEQKVAQLLAVPLVIDDQPPESAGQATSSAAATPSAAAQDQATASAQPDTLSQSSPAWIEENNPGFIVLFGRDIRRSQAKDTVSTYKSLAVVRGDALLPGIAIDHEGGLVQRLSGIGYTTLPSWREFCGLPSADRLEMAEVSAAELRETGVDIVLAPVLDTSDYNPALGNRICSGDEEVVASVSAEVARAYLDNGVMPVFKHFPGIGSVNVDLHRSFAQTMVGGDTSELFRGMMTNFPDAGVMISHVGVTNSQSPNEPCSVSSECVGALHRLFPDVLTFSDALNMVSAAYAEEGSRTLVEVSLAAAEAGNDVLLFEQGVTDAELEQIFAALLERYQRDEGFAAQVDNSVVKIIKFKKMYNLVSGG